MGAGVKGRVISERRVAASVSESDVVGDGGDRGDGVGMVTGWGIGVVDGDGTVIVCTAVGEEAGYGGLIIGEE